MFGVSPSKLDVVRWSNSLNDIEVRTKVKVGENQARIVQDYQTLVSVVSQVFGSEQQTSTSKPKTNEPQNLEELTSAFASVFGNARG